MQSAKIFSGTSSESLTNEICKRYGIKQGKINIQRFSDGEMSPTFMESIRGDFVFLILETLGRRHEHQMQPAGLLHIKLSLSSLTTVMHARIERINHGLQLAAN